MKFNALVKAFEVTHTQLQANAIQALSKWLIIRNWLYGMYIVEYEQQGSDRAKYGEKLITSLSKRLQKGEVKGISPTNLRTFRAFYNQYPQMSTIISTLISNIQPIQQSTVELRKPLREGVKETTNIKSGTDLDYTNPHIIIKSLTYTHIAELVRIEDNVKRTFYELETIKGEWSVGQLKRQIESLLFERSELSTQKKDLLVKVHESRHVMNVEDIIKDPLILEFTGLKELPKYTESNLEGALVDHLQEFILELGNGFCFEARQKRITVDGEHDRVDLVFYHRILKSHVLFEIKIREFKHSDVGQMNYYLNYFKDKVKANSDNEPIGIILATGKRAGRVEYATAGLSNQVFVSKYLVQLPSEKQLKEFINKEKDKLSI